MRFQCLDLCTQSYATNKLEQNFDSCQKNFVEFQDRYSERIAQRKMPTPEDNDGCSDVSLVSSRASVS